MAGSKLHPAALWLPLVVGLVLALGWVALRKPSPPNPEAAGAGTATPVVSGSQEQEPSTAIGTQGWDLAPPSNPLPPPPEDTSRAEEQTPEPHVADPTAQAALGRAQTALKQKQFGVARREALACLKLDPRDRACQRARVHSYTQQYPMGETKNILGWCLSAFSSDLDCLRALREFHAAKGQRVEASGISAEIRERFPGEALEMEPLPSSEPDPPAPPVE
ncbi:MAG: hypothetical protein R3B07_01900 [Polyangiaceae bacterium]